MATTEQVIIEFITNDEQLKSSEQRLTDLGKIDKVIGEQFKTANAEINKQTTALKTVADAALQIDSAGKLTKRSLDALASAVKTVSSFQLKRGMVEEIHKAGLTVNEFQKALDKTVKSERDLLSTTDLLVPTTDNFTTSQVALKKELTEIVKQLAKMKLAGEENTKQYQALIDRAGALKKAMSDVNQQLKVTASNTKPLDGLISATTGVAGGFSVAQGAVALFGDTSEDLQKTLLRVNAAMAILQGLQAIQNVLQKESAAAILLNTVATKAQAAAQLVWNFIIGSSTGLLKLFRIALAATGVGLLVIGIMELVQAFKSSNSEMEDANSLIERQKQLLEELNSSIQQRADVEIARLRLAGAMQSEIDRASGLALVKQRNALRDVNKELIEMAKLVGTGKVFNELNKEIEENTKNIKALNNEIFVKSIDYEKQLKDERKAAADKRLEDAKKFGEDQKRLAEEARQREKEARAAGFADAKAFRELELLAVEKGSQEELEIRKNLLRAELQQALDNDKLTDNQRKLLVKQFFADRINLEKQFAKDRDKVILENINSDIQAELQGLELSNERRLELTETSIQIAAQLEIDAAEGNAQKITEINAKRDKAIRDARIASIQQSLEYELSISAVSNAANIRALQKDMDAEKTTLQERISIINELATIQSDAIQKRIDALNEERKKGLISQKDYNLQYAQLVDEQTKVWEDAEHKKTKVTETETEKRRRIGLEDFKNAIKVAEAVSQIMSGLSSLAADKENQRIDEARQRIKDLQDAGAITEKEAITRMKRVDAEERRIKTQQAQRDKALALFNAVISTAKGIAEAIPNPFLIALAAAIGAAQIAIIAARPIPKFGKGKKNQYEGLAEVGETGTELIQRNGGMEVASKRQITWLSKNDKVFNPMETAAMMSHSPMNTERVVNNTSNKNVEINYEKLGEAVGKHVKTDVYVDGVKEQHLQKQAFEKYLDSRRSF